MRKNMKKTVMVISAALLFAALSYFYLHYGEGSGLLAESRLSESGLTERNETDGSEQDENSGGDGSGACGKTELSAGSAGTGTEEQTVPALENGFSEQEKQELKEIIGACLSENLNAMLEDGRLAAALANYAAVSSELVNINTADTEELTKLNGIGPAKAEAIVRYREEHGGFRSVDELTEVQGISAGTLEKLREQVTL